ncbi:MAG: hypothetical protein MZU97_27250 [Bacillus subtilis]|nr:hypothetical protein [Bacillus subtilis]
MAYKGGKGVFGLDFSVKQGEAFGYPGPERLRQDRRPSRLLMGFMRPAVRHLQRRRHGLLEGRRQPSRQSTGLPSRAKSPCSTT